MCSLNLFKVEGDRLAVASRPNASYRFEGFLEVIKRNALGILRHQQVLLGIRHEFSHAANRLLPRPSRRHASSGSRRPWHPTCRRSRTHSLTAHRTSWRKTARRWFSTAARSVWRAEPMTTLIKVTSGIPDIGAPLRIDTDTEY